MKYINTNKSKALSLFLRHKPEAIGLELDSKGWGSVDIILDKLDLTLDQLKSIVEYNDKKRFEFDNAENPTKIRARQGHSLGVDVELNLVDKLKFPITVFHATPTKNVSSILRQGLSKGKRNHVHMSKFEDTTINAAKRKSNDVTVLEITFTGAQDEPTLFLSNNNVYLATFVPRHMIKIKKNDSKQQ